MSMHEYANFHITMYRACGMHYQLKEYNQEVSGICASTVHTSPAFNENYGSGLQRFEWVKHSKYATVDFYTWDCHICDWMVNIYIE